MSAPSIPCIRFRDPALESIWGKVQSGVRLNKEDGLTLFNTDDLLSLGRIADFAARRISGNNVYFVLNVHINPTNICVLSCKFCDFAAKKGDAHAYEMSIEDILDRIHPELNEVHIVGGHHPDIPFEWYEELLGTINRERPNVQIKAFTAPEIDFFSKRWKLSEDEVFDRLAAVGHRSLTGGGAEVFSERVRRILFRGKVGAKRWFEIHAMAHARGLRSTATMLYGHIESLEERVIHLMRLREAQDHSGGFTCFIPLEYQLGTTNLVSRHASPLDDLRVLAVSRLMLDNIPHIKAYWVMSGESTAAIGLNFGADDMDGTIGEEKIAHAAHANSPLGIARDQIARLIEDAGKTPVLRDAVYEEMKAYGS
jgi:aminodeoxyfutalosine synthase